MSSTRKSAAPATSRVNASKAGEQNILSAESIQQIVALEAEKESRTPAQQKIDSRLLQSVRESRGQKMAAGVDLVPANVDADGSGRVLVDIDGAITDDLVTKIENLGSEIIFPSFEFKTVRAKVSLSQIETIAGFPGINFIRPAVKSLTSRASGAIGNGAFGSVNNGRLMGPIISSTTPNAGAAHPSTFAGRAANVRGHLLSYLASPKAAAPFFTGSVTGEGDAAHRANEVRASFGYSGAGVKIGVLSDSFNSLGGAPADVLSGDLPGPGNPLGNLTPVTVLQDFNPGADEGRAMLQIVHDVAPKAQLFFATADISEAGFASNIIALRNAGCDIIIDDVFYFDEPVFQDGIVAQAVNTVTSGGALYFSSAGNEGNLVHGTAGIFEGDFNDAGSPAFTFPGGAKSGTIHNFGTIGSPVNGDIILFGGFAYTLNWADPFNASTNDYDLFVVSSGGTVKASSTNIQNGSQPAFEIIDPLGLAAGDRLVVFKTAAATPLAFSINTLRGQLTVATTGQTHGHSAAADAFSVAATPAATAFSGPTPDGPFPGAFVGTNQVETFSSDGPRRVFFNADGTAITPGNFLFGTSGGTVRNKPDITAADGVVTTLDPNSGLNPFYGTSAAAPYAGAIAALLKSANPALTPAQMRTILTTTALDIEGAGYDNVSGFGIVQAFQAMQAISPTPQADINLGTVTATDGTFSNHNGVIDPGEQGNIVVQLTNPSMVAATAVSATLSTTTPGVTVDKGTASYGTIAALGNATNGGTPFGVSVNSIVPCGTIINFSLNVTYSGPNSPQVFLFSVTVGSLPPILNGTLGNVPPTAAGVTSTSGQQTGRLARTGVTSSCAAPKANPGLTTVVGSRQFDAYTFTNTSASPQCVTVTMTSPNGVNIYTAAYTSAGFVPANPSTNYLADAGSSSAAQTYSFTAPAGQAFTVVVHDINVIPTSGSAYSLSVTLATCTAGPACTPVNVSPVGTIASGSTGTPYAQTFSATGGSGNYTFVQTGVLPAGLSFTGNTLSGTPTQAGSFPITVTANDQAGCPSGFQNYTLVITGVTPASVTVTSGSGQSTLPSKDFAAPLKATVRDAGNAPMPGINVTFTAPGAGASGTFPGNSLTATVVTDANGVATAPTFTANTISGSYIVAATVVGVGAPANFSLTNASCATYVVTSSADSGPGTLRDILTSPCSGTTITFAANLPAFNPASSQINLTTELPITAAMNIVGPGADQLTISGSNLTRIFNIAAGASAVSISGITLRDGAPVGGTFGGGAILVNNGAAAGAVNLTDMVITNNDASAAGNPLGGGIDNEGGVVTISRCSVVNNTATFRGGGIQNQGFGSMIITDSTIAGNTAGTTGIGGGIRNLLNLTLTNDTIFGNSANSAGNVSRSAGTITFGNTIIAGGTLIGGGVTGPDVSGAGFTSADFNLIQDTSSATIGGTTTHNITGVSPNLKVLGNYGGTTLTLLPNPSSPVINAGNTALVAGNDQRGFARFTGGQADIGSVETNYVLAATAGTPQSATLLTNFATALKATLTESGIPSSGTTVSFTAPGAGASGLFGALTTASVVTDVNGVATAPTFTANSTAGSYNVTASSGGPIPNATFALTNNKAATTSAVVSSANPSVSGQSVTFTATVSTLASGLGTPTGTVDFKDGASTIAAGVPLNGSAQATFSTAALSVASHSITVVYNGDASFLTSTSPAITQVVTKAQTNTQVSSTLNPSTFGQTVTFNVTVAAVPPGAGVPTGTVQFQDGGVNFGGPVALVAGGGTMTTSSLPAGVHLITAIYSGDGNFLTSTSLGATQTVFKENTTTATVISSVNPSVFGQPITFTTTVTPVAPGPGSTTPTGTVQFFDNTHLVGTSPVNGVGVASVTLITPPLGTAPNQVITATYSGDIDYNGSTTATALLQTVNKADTSATTPTSTINPTVFGQATLFQTTITAVPPGAGIPGGTVTFFDGATPIGTSNVVGAGAAGIIFAGLSAGSHSITAVYSGTQDFNGTTSAALTQVVNKASTTTSVISGINPTVFGQSAIFVATVNAVAPGAGSPSGTVTFFDGATPIATGTVNGSGIAQGSFAGLSVGTHTINATYNGDASFLTSSGSLAGVQTVVKAQSNTAPSSGTNPSVFGQSVTFTATVTAKAPGAGTPTGTVTFLDGLATIGTGTLNGGGIATFTTTALAVGSHSITMNYNGDGNFFFSFSTVLTQVVNKANATPVVVSSVNPALFGQNVTFTITVSAVAPGAGTPSGIVEIHDDGLATLGTATLNGSGVATFTTNTLSVGTHPIFAVYQGDNSFNGGAGPIINQVINQAPTNTALTSSANPSVFGQPVVLTATVTSLAPPIAQPTASPTSRTRTISQTRTVTTRANGTKTNATGIGTPSGTVTFFDNGVQIGTATLNGSGVGTLTVSNLIVGTHPITAVYGGDVNFLTSTSTVLTQTVNKSNSNLSNVTSSANPSVFGQSVTFSTTATAAVPGGGIPTGTVTFLDGATTLGTVPLVAGVATFPTSALVVGTHPITATYAGDINFNPSATIGTLNQIVNKAATTTVITSSTPLAFVGSTVTYTATINPVAPGAGVPSGTVQFMDNGVNIGAPVTMVAGKASVTESGLTYGLHVITAIYSGDGSFLASTGTLAGGQNVGFQFIDPVNNNKLIIDVVNSKYTFITGGGVTLANNVSVILQFDQAFPRVLRFTSANPIVTEVLIDESAPGTLQGKFYQPSTGQNFVMNITSGVKLTP